MAKGYVFRDFFDYGRIATQDWVSNGHFIIKRSELRKTQNAFVDTFPEDYRANSIKEVYDNIVDKYHKYSGLNDVEFVPKFIDFDFEDSGKHYNILIDKNNVIIREEYYNFVKSLKCKLIYNTEDTTILIIFNKDNDIVGVLLPIRVKGLGVVLERSKNYNNYKID